MDKQHRLSVGETPDGRQLTTEPTDGKAQETVELVDVKQEPDIKAEPDDEVDTIEYVQLSHETIVAAVPKIEKVESDDDEYEDDDAWALFDQFENGNWPNFKTGSVARPRNDTKTTDNEPSACASHMVNNPKEKNEVNKEADVNGAKVAPITKSKVVQSKKKSPSANAQRNSNRQSTYSANKKVHKCSECGYVAPSPSELIRHMRTHNGDKPFPCNSCHKRFSQKVNLQSHMRIHNGIRPFQCGKCTMKFTRKNILEDHLNICSLKFRCSVCARNFLKESNKDAHEMNCKCRRYECYLCQSYMANLKQQLQSHMRVKHTGERPYECHLCGNRFAMMNHLNGHMKNIHKQ